MFQFDDYELRSVDGIDDSKFERLTGIDENSLSDLLKNYKLNEVFAKRGIVSMMYHENDGNITLIITYIKKELKEKRIDFAMKLRNKLKERKPGR
jgi:ABC-type multidrug transport system permease subunit